VGNESVEDDRESVQRVSPKSVLLSVHPQHPEPRKIRRAVEALQAGQLVGYPTDTVYGLGCDLFNKKAADQLYAMRHLEKAHPMAFLCEDLSQVARYAIVEDHVFRVLRRLLPGPYCFILEATREVPKMVQSKRKTVGIRVPHHPVTQALVRELGHPILTATAVHPETSEALIDPDEIDHLYRGLAVVLDAGAGGMEPTTVVDMSGPHPVVLREGAGDVTPFQT
jgi:tRNA threonylcarbamoyl adenosine modification protein (Sua5/YciO/YrdC/YwlC family)